MDDSTLPPLQQVGMDDRQIPHVQQVGMDNRQIPHVLKVQTQWENLFFYQKSDVIYQLAFTFCERFIHLYKDRTRDQVIQAARSCKQNIVEGLADGVTSTEMQLKLLNVARASLKELREDFEDYLKSRHLKFYGEAPADSIIPAYYYDASKVKYDAMLAYCRQHNKLAEYEPFFSQWTDEEMCNYGVTLCHMIDKMMLSFMEKLEHEFVTEGGIKERMYKARTGYRQSQDERLRQLEAERPSLLAKIAELQAQLNTTQAQFNAAQSQLNASQVQLKVAQIQLIDLGRQLSATQAQLSAETATSQRWQAAYDDLKQSALSAYYRQQQEIAELRGKE